MVFSSNIIVYKYVVLLFQTKIVKKEAKMVREGHNALITLYCNKSSRIIVYMLYLTIELSEEILSLHFSKIRRKKDTIHFQNHHHVRLMIYYFIFLVRRIRLLFSLLGYDQDDKKPGSLSPKEKKRKRR